MSKETRIVEEVAIYKDATDRVETVRDKVRHQEVEIEKVPGTTQTTTSAAVPPKSADGTL